LFDPNQSLHFKAIKQLNPLPSGAEEYAVACALDRVMDCEDSVYRESFPDMVTDALSRWEAMYGLSGAGTIEERQQVLLAAINRDHGIAKRHYLATASALGFNVIINSPPRMFRAGVSRAGFAVYEDAEQYTWEVIASPEEIEVLKPVFEREKPPFTAIRWGFKNIGNVTIKCDIQGVDRPGPIKLSITSAFDSITLMTDDGMASVNLSIGVDYTVKNLSTTITTDDGESVPVMMSELVFKPAEGSHSQNIDFNIVRGDLDNQKWLSNYMDIDPTITYSTSLSVPIPELVFAEASMSVLDHNGFFWRLSYQENQILKIDPRTNTVKTFQWSFANNQRHYAGCLTPDGKIWFIPNDATYCLVINASDDTFSTLQVSDNLGAQKWMACACIGDYIYAPPYNATGNTPDGRGCLVISWRNSEFSIKTVAQAASSAMWAGCCVAKDAKIYCAPRSNSYPMLVITPNNGEPSFNTIAAPTSGNNRFYFATLDGYGDPVFGSYVGNFIYKYDIATGAWKALSTNRFGNSLNTSPIVMGRDGNIYSFVGTNLKRLTNGVVDGGTIIDTVASIPSFGGLMSYVDGSLVTFLRDGRIHRLIPSSNNLGSTTIRSVFLNKSL
jgi:uncharacterized protein YmfQ (DUF2313 family)